MTRVVTKPSAKADSISSEKALDLWRERSLASMNLQVDDSTPKAPVAAPRGFLRAAVAMVLATAFVAAAIGFVGFLSQLRGAETVPDRKADGNVVLTGGSSRVSDAMELLAAGYGKRHLKNPEDLHESRPSPRTESLIASAVQWAERIMRRIEGVYR